MSDDMKAGIKGNPCSYCGGTMFMDFNMQHEGCNKIMAEQIFNKPGTKAGNDSGKL